MTMTIDWNTGSWQSSDSGTKPARITIASDWMPLRAFEELILDEPAAVFGDLLSVLRDGDLNLVNVECALGEGGAPILKAGPCLKASARAVDSLRAANFHVACLANNHTLDHGDGGLQSTLSTLREAGLRTVGAGMSYADAAEPLLATVNKTRLAVINCAEGEACASLAGGPGSNPFDIPTLTHQIERLKKSVDAVIVVFHGGREYSPLPPLYVVDALRALAEAGAAAVVAHHPHVPQGIEIHRGVPIVYSQGNFVFWEESQRYFRHVGYLVHLDFGGGRLAGLCLTPYRIQRQGLRAMNDAERQELYGYLRTVSEPLANRQMLQQAWEAWVDHEGEAGMIDILRDYLRTYEIDPKLAAARLHNLFFCPAHREWYMNGLKRLSRGELGNSPAWAKSVVQQWTSQTISG